MVQLGSDRSSLGPMVEAILKERGRTLAGDTHPERGYFFRSDHFPFAKVGVPALSLSEPKQFTGPNAAALLKKQEAYNGKDYHQPSDQYDPSWDFSGGVDDMRVLAQLGWRIAAQPEMPKYNDGDQFARGQEESNVEPSSRSTRSTPRASASRHRARTRRCIEVPWPACAKAPATALRPSGTSRPQDLCF